MSENSIFVLILGVSLDFPGSTGRHCMLSCESQMAASIFVFLLILRRKAGFVSAAGSATELRFLRKTFIVRALWWIFQFAGWLFDVEALFLDSF